MWGVACSFFMFTQKLAHYWLYEQLKGVPCIIYLIVPYASLPLIAREETKTKIKLPIKKCTLILTVINSSNIVCFAKTNYVQV